MDWRWTEGGLEWIGDGLEVYWRCTGVDWRWTGDGLKVDCKKTVEDVRSRKITVDEGNMCTQNNIKHGLRLMIL